MADITDRLFSSQWHLLNPTAGLFDLNVFSVWNPADGAAYTGAGTRTVVIDNGFDYLHRDLAANYDTELDFDFEFNTLDAFGGDSDSHGTAVAGLIGAAANGIGVVGVAYETSLVGYRTAGEISGAWLQDVRDAIYHAAVSAQGDVTNISQSISNDTSSTFGQGYRSVRFEEIKDSIGTAVASGRSGLGMTIVKSAGNAREYDYDVNADDWGNDTRQIIVGAVDQDGFVSSYSSYGAALLVSAFGTPGEVVTTDRSGSAGYTQGGYTSTFDGTSAAAPMVAGIVALMYEANPGLGWRDVQSILAASARHVGSEIGSGPAGAERFTWEKNGATTWNGGGQHFSNDYGYGLVDARAAVRLAETWLLAGVAAATSGNEAVSATDVLDTEVTVPDGNARGLTFSGKVSADDAVERVTVEVAFSTTYTADMQVNVTSPSGTTSRLIADTGNGGGFTGTWTFESQAFRGERAAGNWSVTVIDTARLDLLTVSDIVIRVFGSRTSDDRHVFTDEYAASVVDASETRTIADTNGGVDTVNASAVTTDSIIRLDGRSGSIAGVSVGFVDVENAIGGDGADTLRGDSRANELHGMRGSDTILGFGGNDTISGGSGDDVITPGRGVDYTDAGSGNDVVFDDDSINGDVHNGGPGVDRIDFSRVTLGPGDVTIDLQARLATAGDGATERILRFEDVTGSMGSETIIGTRGANTLRGMDGDDILRGGGGLDILIGGLGDDIFHFTRASDSAPDARNIVQAGDGASAFEGVGVAGGDRIDLSDLYDGTLTFGGTRVGRVSLVDSGTDTLVRVNLTEDDGFEFELLIADGSGVVASDYAAIDFIL